MTTCAFRPRSPVKRVLCAVLSAGLMLPLLAAAQSKASDTDLKVLIAKLKADKKVVVALNMNLTEAEEKVFWPVYDEYQNDLQPINERLIKAIGAYAQAYNSNTLTDDQARKLTNEALAIEAEEVKLRMTYFAKLCNVVSAKTAARYIQIESKIRAAIRYDMADTIPLVP